MPETILYLTTIVSANLLLSYLGPQAVVPIALVLIGFDITLRDKLHNKWSYKLLWIKMFLLIVTGSVITYVINRNAQHIAIASTVAFSCAALSDTLVYQVFHKKHTLYKVNASNIVSSAVDSTVFITLAFGLPILWSIIAVQILAKFIGGFLWSLILQRCL